GFLSVYHFSRAFKLVTGYTPTEYRAQQLKMML
ncbi:MAG: helix-turn-helix transcriptional regulator, partial [Clostridia bacterium]|nr:helix-turn-helix transcriptional regulator [Clostridia bacterium]